MNSDEGRQVRSVESARAKCRRQARQHDDGHRLAGGGAVGFDALVGGRIEQCRAHGPIRECSHRRRPPLVVNNSVNSGPWSSVCARSLGSHGKRRCVRSSLLCDRRRRRVRQGGASWRILPSAPALPASASCPRRLPTVSTAAKNARKPVTSPSFTARVRMTSAVIPSGTRRRRILPGYQPSRRSPRGSSRARTPASSSAPVRKPRTHAGALGVCKGCGSRAFRLPACAWSS